MISVEDALARVLALAGRVKTENVPLQDAAGRVMITDAISRITQPPFAASAMDGYAICDADHRKGAVLQVIGEAGAGHGFTGHLAQGQSVRIFTGAPVPTGADRVVLQEDCTRVGQEITLGDKLEIGTHIRPAGQDFRSGDVLAAPRRLRPADLGLLAAMNISQLEVARRPVVAIMATGDELVMPGECPGPDQIIASNSFALAAMIEAAGGVARILPIARDNEDSLRFAFGLAKDADVIVTTGGASVGDHDLVGKVATDLGMERAFWKIAMRPGKPLMAGRLMGAAMLGLPGNPVSAIVCAHLFLIPLLEVLQGLKGEHDTRSAQLGTGVEANGTRTHYMRARLKFVDGAQVITPFSHQDSALLSILSEANALLVRPVNDVARTKGETVGYLPI